MSEQQSPAAEDRPNFVFGGNRVVSEENWAQYQAEGVVSIIDALDEGDLEQFRATLAKEVEGIGVENLLLGDAFDRDAGRPLRHKPGVGVYATAAGIEREEALVKAGRLRERPFIVLPDGRHVVAQQGARRIRVRPRRPSA
jgi:hypothetical protein